MTDFSNEGVPGRATRSSSSADRLRRGEPDPVVAIPPSPQPSAISWDQLSAEPRKRRSKLRTLVSILMGMIGAVVVLTILLVSVGPRFLPYQTYVVRSGSMEPTIRTGAMVVLTKVDGAQLGPGDIVTFKNPEDTSMLVTHRVVGVETTDQGRVFVTQGDSNAHPDPWRVPASGTGWKLWFNVPVLGFVFGYLGTLPARVALLVIPAAILALLALTDLRRRRSCRRPPA